MWSNGYRHALFAVFCTQAVNAEGSGSARVKVVIPVHCRNWSLLPTLKAHQQTSCTTLVACCPIPSIHQQITAAVPKRESHLP
jgi:hypothetical protein